MTVRPRRITFDARIASDRVDGVTRYAIGLVEGFSRAPDEFEFDILVPDGLAPTHPLTLALKGPPIRPLFRPPAARRLPSHLWIGAFLRRHPTELYHHPHFTFPLTAPTPAVVTIQESFQVVPVPAWSRAYFWAATAFALARARAVIAVSPIIAENLIRIFPRIAERLQVILYGIDPAFETPLSPEELAAARDRHALRGPYFLFVGTNWPHKNLATLVRAFAQIAGEVPHQLLIVGQDVGDLAVARLARELGIEQRVRHLGYQPTSELRALYHLADAYVLASLTDAFGLPAFEALASGTAVICSSATGAARYVGDAALIVDPRSAASIAAALRRLALDVTLRERLRAGGPDQAKELSWSRTVAKTLDVYRGVLEEPRKRSG